MPAGLSRPPPINVTGPATDTIVPRVVKQGATRSTLVKAAWIGGQ